MSKKTNADRFILTAATLFLLLFSYFLYDDSLLFPKREVSGQRTIGRINISGNDVRLKSASTFSWSPAHQVDTVRMNDSIFTGERSKAQIVLEDGTLLNVEANSLVTLNARDGQMNLDLRYGFLDTKLGSSALKIQSEGKTYELTGTGSVRINKSAAGIEVSVTGGSAKLKDQKGVREIASGGLMKVTEEGSFENAPTPLITTPADKARVQASFRTIDPEEQRTASTRVSWTTNSLFSKYEYEIARDGAFADRLHLAETKQGDVETPASGNGTYTYRVRGVYKDGRKSPWSDTAEYQVELTPDLIPPPEAPVMSRKVYDFNPSEQKKRSPSSVPKPSVSWSKVDRAKSYRVQFSRSPDFENSQSYNVENENLNWPDYKPGLWHVRVVAVSEEGLSSPPSAPSRLQVKMDELILDPFNKLLLTGAKPPDEAPPGEVTARWTPVSGASSYLVQLDTASDFPGPQQFKLSAKSGSLPLVLPRPGQYHVRVQALDADNRAITSFSKSEIAEYEYVAEKKIIPPAPLRAPALVEPFDQSSIFLQSTRKPNIWLEWKQVRSAGQYEIEISLEPEFKNPLIATRIKNNRYLLQRQIPVGNFYWRVRSFTPNGSEASEWAASRQFTISSEKNEAYIP